MTIKPIRTPADLRTSKARLALLMTAPNTDQHDDEIEVLTTLIEQYEQKHTPIDAPTPVAAIKFRMDEKGLSARELEPFIGTRARISEVFSGKRQLSIDMIRSLHEGLNIPYESLISGRSPTHDSGNVSTPAVDKLNELGFNIKANDVGAFISASMSNPSLTLLRKTRTQRAVSKTDQNALLLWQAAILQRSEQSPLRSLFKPSAFTKDSLRQLAKLSVRADGPRQAIDRLITFGISVVILPALPGTFLDGAAMVNQKGAPVIGLTLRHDRIDNFWYTLLHECAHIALHFNEMIQTHEAFIDDMDIRGEDEFEREADALARDTLIPPQIHSETDWNENTSLDELHTLSSRARVHISVVAGRWQRDHQNYKRFSRLIERNSIKPMLNLGD
ncbi:MAG TPA: ImmA/IrrE family metallo-endopeptidase [Afipia sp.]|jgi:HTH-type transcriptional regulator / antitoxin HigA|uniref:HTH-type transcriptional regulator/antitoxin HigA n=1 Tax=Afipia massiliensis TaxID=211460 RepID=A0A840NAC5_9BRAD|nr:ImmA/IrrE family metallo-endopeptidase [Afipia massiliensis]MBB5053656.1 HTH-type transcriptional regulator/antitoxin HigA [Afipia massiliensis]HCX16613.1 ImmA/IrrE family metallo-endopeptidase [Afipia sp.]|tara:strand:+ start:442 stop:1608 length:1167 start_codon:yes stop_codon:yes gene_type:complete